MLHEHGRLAPRASRLAVLVTATNAGEVMSPLLARRRQPWCRMASWEHL